MSTNITEIKNDRLNEKYFKIDHESGLTVYVFPKEGYKSTYAVYGTNFGSVNTHFIANGKEIISPDGIAHYLEHKLFESEDGDAFTKYAKTGANANAYTSFEKTCYLFSCSTKLEENLRILLGFVQHPYFTDETVAKEQGIIGQEIRMYDDDPDWRVMFNLLGGMYHNHPVKVDIAGTVETIAEITPAKLYECYNSFYTPENMALCVVGNAGVDTVIRLVDELVKKSQGRQVERIFPEEPYGVATDYVEQTLPVTVPLFQLGFKADGNVKLNEKQTAACEVMLMTLASNYSPMYKELMDNGLINESFGYEQLEGPYYNGLLFSGESKNPKAAAEIIKKHVLNALQNGLDKEDFEIAKKAIYADYASYLNSVTSIGGALISCAFTGRELFKTIEAVAELEIGDAQEMLKFLLDPSNTTLSVIKGGQEDV